MRTLSFPYHRQFLTFFLALFAAASIATVNAAESPQQRRGAAGGSGRGVYRAQVSPHWFADNTRFWYRNDLRDGAKEFIVVDVVKGERRLAFDHAQLASALSTAAGEQFKTDHLPFAEIEFSPNLETVQFEAGGKSWSCNLSSYTCVVATNSTPKTSSMKPGEASRADAAAASEFSRASSEGEAPGSPQADTTQSDGHSAGGALESRRERGRTVRSPDGKWSAFIRENNVFLRGDPDGKETQLSQDGGETNAYGRLEWSPDSKSLVSWRIEPGDRKEVYLIQSSPRDGGRAVLRHRPYPVAGDKFSLYEPNIFDVVSGKQLKPEVDRYEHEWEAPRLRWSRDQRHFAYQQVDRGHQRLRVIEIDCTTGAARSIIDEKSSTFIWTAHTENLNMTYVNWLEKSDEIVYVSERDGWRHLYLVDVKTGKIKNQITRGEWVVRGIDRIDEEARQVWFRAGGMNADQDPYLVHYYRINFDGSGLVALTRGNGTHSVQYSPDRKYLIDTYSRVDLPPANELRRVSDGGLVCTLEEADIAELKDSGWQPPEVFVAKGRDGKTDIWGIICVPRSLDPTKKYPVLEQIYAGPQSAYVPKSFSASRRFASYTDRGFIVVQIDGMGTAFRSKAFHDVCWKNLKDAGFPDRILWHKAAAAKHSFYDLARVGVFGTSAGGQNSAGAVLFHPELYKAAVANCGCHDNRMDKASWNEQWMGYPVGPQYSDCSNIDNAGKLGGYLFLIVGEVDSNVPPESTLRFVDALIREGKDFELLVVPNADHGARGPAGPYVDRRTQDFFVHHLMGEEPPNRNASGLSLTN